MKDYVPKPHQRIAQKFVLDKKFCALWAKPGMGKTSVVYSVLDILLIAGSNFFPVLVIAPKKVCELTWPAEAKKWRQFSGLRIVSLLGEKKQREETLLNARGDVYVINYELLPWLVNRLGRNWPFKILVIDEATKVKGYRERGGGFRSSQLATVAERSGRVIELTGTPSPNGLKDLWGQIWFLDGGERLGSSYTAFLNRWFIKDAYTGEISPRENAEAEIYEKLADITLSLRPEDFFDIDEPIFMQREVELPREAKAAYDTMETRFFLEIEGKEIDALNAMVLSTKLLQMASGTVYDNEKATVFVHDAKIEALRSIIEESGGEPVLTVYQYRSQIAALKEAIPGTRVFRTKQDQADWNAGKIPHMLIHPESAGHGVDLQDGGRTMVFFTGTWNLEHRLQVIERIGPMRQIQSGHPRAVMVYDIIADDTLDRALVNRMEQKQSVQEALMAARAARL